MGYSTKEMANKLGLSYFTVKKHRENILLKVGARGKTEFRKFVFEYELSPKQPK
jgi:DNA-binding CsgD family transcriptional regulator